MQDTEGQDAPPQFTIATTVNGEPIGEDVPLDDPFVMHTVTIDPADLQDAYLNDQPVTVVVRINGTPAALRHVFQPIDLTPNLPVDREPLEGATSAAYGDGFDRA